MDTPNRGHQVSDTTELSTQLNGGDNNATAVAAAATRRSLRATQPAELLTGKYRTWVNFLSCAVDKETVTHGAPRS